MTTLLVMGLMSGTSADGIDAVLLAVPAHPQLEDVRYAHHFHRPYSPEERDTIFALFDTERTTARNVCMMNFRIGEWFADASLEAVRSSGHSIKDVDLIGSHGQTVFHSPPGAGGESQPSTLQIGEPSVIAERTGITTVGDFRVRDMAAGGHGAPLVSYVDVLLFAHATETRVVLNLGGIANATIVPPIGARAVPLAFDTGPANMVLDWLVSEGTDSASSFDNEGLLAAAGNVDETLLAELLADPYFAAPPPKTTGRERFGAAFAAALWARARRRGLRLEDALATALALTAETVARAIVASELTHGPISEVIAGGGGTKNPTLVQAIQERLPKVRVTAHEQYGVSSQAKEALSFAILASAALRGQVNTIPSCTGAVRPVVMGKIVPGENYLPLLRKTLFSPGEPS
ncbi:MAG TPA: anhydro-N-acetylmuramic acid kinase [Chloroflexota bacterium]|nr:anhydro-N-acetylmuramic acid kinase [Chloroflexota bacterium]